MDTLHDDTVGLMQDQLGCWVVYSELVWLDFEEHEEWAFGVYNYIDDIHAFYVNQYGPGVIIVTAGHPAEATWNFYTSPEIVMAFVETMRACTAVMRETLEQDKDLDPA